MNYYCDSCWNFAIVYLGERTQEMFLLLILQKTKRKGEGRRNEITDPLGVGQERVLLLCFCQ
jgi:hypothetical protein